MTATPTPAPATGDAVQQADKHPLAMIGPITFDMKVHITSDDGSCTGEITIGLAPGRLPTAERLHLWIGEALASLPEGTRLMDAREFFNGVLVKQKTGRVGKFALPSDFSFDTSALVEASTAAWANKDTPPSAQGGA